MTDLRNRLRKLEQATAGAEKVFLIRHVGDPEMLNKGNWTQKAQDDAEAAGKDVTVLRINWVDMDEIKGN